MKKLSAVIFPDTIPAVQALIPLVLVFEPLVYCQPVENDDPCDIHGTLCTEMIGRSLASLHSFAPLKESRDRFLHLVRDIELRRDDYAAQLSHVSLASLSTGSQSGTESRSSILSSLLSGHGIDSEDNGQKEQLLWQARLVLKLGEQYDADQQRIKDDMQNIHQREQQLFAGVSRESDSPFSLTGRLTSLVSDSSGMQDLRLKAWARILAFGSKPLAGQRVFVSTNPDAVDRLCEEYERRSGKRPVAFLTVPLPAGYPDESRFLEQFHQFLQDEATVRYNLIELLSEPSIASEQNQRMFVEEGGEWSALLNRYFPEQDCGRCQLVLYDLPEVQPEQLFLDSFGHDDEIQPGLETTQNIVIGLLSGQ